MKKAFLFFLILFLVGCQIQRLPEVVEQNLIKDIKPSNNLNAEDKSMKILTLYDNYTVNSDLKTDWGFAALISVEDYNLLFDTGTDGKILLSNMEKLGVEPKDINKVMISHDHYDHFGGLTDFLAANNQVKIYILSNFSQTKSIIQKAGVKMVEIDNPTTIIEKISTTGSLGNSIPEQSLILDTEKGLVVITGCAHPGIVNIVTSVKNQLPDKKIYLVMGGFHLFQSSETEIRSIIEDFKNLGVQKVAPCHCTGDKAINLFKEAYQENFIENGVGKLIEL